MSLNRVEIEGSLKGEPVLHFTQAGLPITQMTVAVGDVVYNGETRTEEVRTDWISVVCFGMLAENVENLRLLPGERIHVLGKVSQEAYEKKDGSKESKTRVQAMVITPTRRRRADTSRYDLTGPPSGPHSPPPDDPWSAPLPPTREGN